MDVPERQLGSGSAGEAAVRASADGGCRRRHDWQRLLDRAGPRPGLPLTDDADLHMVVDGIRLDAITRMNGYYAFRLPRMCDDARLVSRAAVPQEIGLARDPRSLGVAVRRILVRQGTRLQTLEANDSRLLDGFHAFEADNDFKWSNGDARLPAGNLLISSARWRSSCKSPPRSDMSTMLPSPAPRDATLPAHQQ